MATQQIDLGPEEVVHSTIDIFEDEVLKGRKEIKRINEVIAILHEKKVEIMERIVRLCNHPLEDLREKPFKSNKDSSLFGSEPEWIICTKCGLTEIGWGIGHVVLKHGAYQRLSKCTEDEWNKWKTIMVHEEDKLNWRK